MRSPRCDGEGEPSAGPCVTLRKVEDDERRDWLREVAVGQFNAAWDLIDKTDRSAEDDGAMVLAAATSRWHWGQVGGPEQTATGDWQVAHVACLLGLGELAALFASRNLATAEAEGWDGWRLASAHEAMARACAPEAMPRDGRFMSRPPARLSNESPSPRIAPWSKSSWRRSPRSSGLEG